MGCSAGGGLGCASWTCLRVSPSALMLGWAPLMAVGGPVTPCLYVGPLEPL